MEIDNIKKSLRYQYRYCDRIIFHPSMDDDVCYIEGMPFTPMYYRMVKSKGISDERIYKCQSIQQYHKNANIPYHKKIKL